MALENTPVRVLLLSVVVTVVVAGIVTIILQVLIDIIPGRYHFISCFRSSSCRLTGMTSRAPLTAEAMTVSSAELALPK